MWIGYYYYKLKHKFVVRPYIYIYIYSKSVNIITHELVNNFLPIIVIICGWLILRTIPQNINVSFNHIIAHKLVVQI